MINIIVNKVKQFPVLYKLKYNNIKIEIKLKYYYIIILLYINIHT